MAGLGDIGIFLVGGRVGCPKFRLVGHAGQGLELPEGNVKGATVHFLRLVGQGGLQFPVGNYGRGGHADDSRRAAEGGDGVGRSDPRGKQESRHQGKCPECLLHVASFLLVSA